MLKQYFGTKSAMQSAYLSETRVAVTKVKVYDLLVTQVKTEAKDGYNAIQVAFGQPRKHPKKPLLGHLKPLKLKQIPRYLKEIKVEDPSQFKVGQTISVADFLKLGQVVKVQGKTKGKGFTGVIKRWGFARQPKTHGQSDRTRAPGSIGQTTGVGRVFKGKKMAGRHGSLTHTVKNSKLIYFDPQTKEIWLTGHLPGNQRGLLTLTVTGEVEPKDFPPQPSQVTTSDVPTSEVKKTDQQSNTNN